MFTQTEGALLLKVARSAIESHLHHRPVVLPKEEKPVLWEKWGVFVTLKKREELRGCIGRIEPTEPLIKAVSHVALEAAFNDPRFAPLREEELEGLSLEVSILSPLRKVRHPEEIQVGRDGLLVHKEFSSGLLLPQVAVESRWTREEFLTYTCLKAGLPATSWREEGVDFYTFTAEVFSEDKLHD